MFIYKLQGMRSQFFSAWYRKNWGWKASVLDFFDIFAFLIFIAGIAGIVRFFVFMPYTVEWASMANTFHDKDFIIVDKITPKYSSLKRWDVVVFIPPGKDIPFIKRIIGLPWETIKLDGWKVYLCKNLDQNNQDCSILTEKYLGADVQTEAKCWVTTFDVTDGYLVMWDNRWYSTDSRCCFGLWCTDKTKYTIAQDRIIGKVFVKLYPQLTSFTDESNQYTP